MSELKKTMNLLKTESIQSYNTIYNIKHGKLEQAKRKFVMACPNNDCRGYLSTQYKCELCKIFTCPTCLDIIGYNKHDQHTCNPDNVTSAEMIKKDTKSCPSCGVRIFKISGCNQMWCTECQVAFDYNTGKIDKGTIHNPHFQAYLEQQNNGATPRNPQDILCGGLCSIYQLNSRVITKLRAYYKDYKNKLYETLEEEPALKYIMRIHRAISTITYYNLVHARENVRELQNLQELRVDYLLKKKDKEAFGTQIYRKDNLRKKYNKLLHIYELLSVVGIEIFNALRDTKIGGPTF